ncbi:hypothetical protein CRG98_043923 [Punica granatum]|uniref:NAD-dependent epimerase/dehydratase domain-containing protein n=1 Tax=Punica granatum TaxID=22663 RepID=A0A2I0HVN9_PUNGR|nr:hypothetical protein CRG98_043923 [Punica granatum]
MEKKRVCVTGAGGFVASWVVKLLLSNGYIVHGTVRKLGDQKYAHLNKLERAPANLKLFKADLLDYDSLRLAIAGCAGVIHVACPVPASALTNPEVEMLEPAIKGTLNVLKACSEAKVKRTVYISSIAAVMMNPKWPKDRVMDETCWSDKEYCRATEIWYYLAKTEAERAAFEYGKQHQLDVVAVNPGYVFGPVLQPTLNTSSLLLVNFLKGIYIQTEPANLSLANVIIGEADSVPNMCWNIVDVRDVAAAVLLAYEESKAEGRYICVAENIMTDYLVKKLRNLYPDLSYSENFIESKYAYRLSSEKLQKLGWTHRLLEETLLDSIESYREVAVLD